MVPSFKWSSMSHTQREHLSMFDLCQRSPDPRLVAMDGRSQISSQLMSRS